MYKECRSGRCQPRDVDGGIPAPDFTLTDKNPHSQTFEQPITLSSYKGRALFLYFAYSP